MNRKGQKVGYEFVLAGSRSDLERAIPKFGRGRKEAAKRWI